MPPAWQSQAIGSPCSACRSATVRRDLRRALASPSPAAVSPMSAHPASRRAAAESAARPPPRATLSPPQRCPRRRPPRRRTPWRTHAGRSRSSAANCPPPSRDPRFRAAHARRAPRRCRRRRGGCLVLAVARSESGFPVVRKSSAPLAPVFAARSRVRRQGLSRARPLVDLRKDRGPPSRRTPRSGWNHAPKARSLSPRGWGRR